MNIIIEDKYGKTLIHGMLKIKLNMSFKEQITSIDIQYINFWNMDGVRICCFPHNSASKNLRTSIRRNEDL